MAIGSTACFLIISIINMIALKKEVGSFVDGKKFVKTIAFSIPLAVLGVFSSSLLARLCGNVVTTIVMIIFLVFFLFIFISAFEIADITGYIRLLRPAYAMGSGKKVRKKKREKHKRIKR